MNRARAGWLFAALVAGCAGAPPGEDLAAAAAAARPGQPERSVDRAREAGEQAEKGPAAEPSIGEGAQAKSGSPVKTTGDPTNTTEMKEPPGSAGAAEAAKARITSTGYTTWIFGRPKVDTKYIGYIRVGEAIGLLRAERVKGEGC